MPTTPLIASLLLLLTGLPSHADHWPNWRGPDGTGKSVEKNLPTEWNPTKNARWKVALPERSNATPVVWGSRILVPQAIEKEGRRTRN